ncbi:MAG: phospholipase D family protein [Rhodocyclaceae bacterium]|nr:phospholipase D family protein [Rhodocyclaceae bacterium]
MKFFGVPGAWRRGVLMLALAALTSPAFAFEAPQSGSGMPAHGATGTIEAAFSPWDDGEALILRTLVQARHDIYVQAFMFTSRGVASALIEAKERGIQVQVLADAQNVAGVPSSQIPRLAAAGIPVALETRYASAHNKIILVDPEHASCAVVTGSYNFTQSARLRNAENLLVLKGDPVLARAYLGNWRRHRTDAVPYAKAELKAQPPRTRGGERLPFPWESGVRSGRDALEME